MPIEGIHPDLHDAAMAMYIANIDFEECKGNTELAPQLWSRFESARAEYRAKKAEIEARGEKAFSE